MRNLPSGLTLGFVLIALSTLVQAQSGVSFSGGALGVAPASGLGVPTSSTNVISPSIWGHADRVVRSGQPGAAQSTVHAIWWVRAAKAKPAPARITSASIS